VSENNPSKKTGEEAVYLSGASVPASGMWRTDHKNCMNALDLWLQKQSSFPPCPACGLPTGFYLLEEILHISEDPDFQ
jgi:hypothetical protein